MTDPTADALRAEFEATRWVCPHVRDGVAAVETLSHEPITTVRFDSKEQIAPWLSELCVDCSARVAMFMMRTCDVRPVEAETKAKP